MIKEVEIDLQHLPRMHFNPNFMPASSVLLCSANGQISVYLPPFFKIDVGIHYLGGVLGGIYPQIAVESDII